MGNSQDLQAVVDAFNRDNQIGAHVQYWTGIREGRGEFSTTRAAAELLSGHTPVVWVAGHSACIALTHVEPVPHQPDGIEELDDKTVPEATRAAERVLAYVTEFGDGLYDVVGGAPLYGRDLVAVAKAVRERNSLARRCAARFEESEVLRAKLAEVKRERDQLRSNLSGPPPAVPVAPCHACDGRGLVPFGDDGELYECRACDGVGGA